MRFRTLLLTPPFIATIAATGCSNLGNDLAEPGDITEAAPVTAMSADECSDGPNANGLKKGFDKRCHHYKHSCRSRSYQAGQAKMTTRALMDVNKITTVEATTGTFDDGSVPPGWFDHIRIRSARLRRNFNLDLDGDDNDFDDLTTKSGYFSTTFPTPVPANAKGKDKGRLLSQLVHGQSLRITGVVKGVDPRTAVITFDDQVKYRPDLSIVRIDAPNAAVGMPASITAMVHERMGDVGALADCLLSVDGVAADSAKNIWVDNNGTVSCQFAHTFATAGTHALHVDVTNVRPADYDMRNNGADGTITVAGSFAFTGSAMDGNFSSTFREQVLDSSSNVVYEQNCTASGHNHSVSISGMWPQTVAFPLGATSVNATSASASWSIFSATSFPGSVQADGSTCASGPDATGANWVTLCTTSVGSPTTQVTVSEFAGDVTYHSDMTCLQTSSFYDCSGGYTWNADGSNSSGVRHALSGSLIANIAVTDAAGASLVGSANIPVQPYSTAQDQPLACTSGPDGSRDCVESHYNEMGTRGSVGL